MRADIVRCEGIRAVVVDIEGTTSPTVAVHRTLFDDARANLGRWLRAHADEPEIADAVAAVRAEAGIEGGSIDDVIATLHAWIDADSKAAPLKTIEGGIWAEGFATGRLAAAFFDDVAPALSAWHAAGVRLAVYSSGAVAVQRPWFAGAGLAPLVSGYYDTVSAGPKREAGSYRRIVDDLAARYGYRAGELLFLSDVAAELDAAASAGFVTIGVARAGEPHATADFGPHRAIGSFAHLEVIAPPEPTASDVREVGARLAAEAARFASLGWMRATSGNLSEVVRRDPLRLVVTASGVDKGGLSPDDVVVVDQAGAPIPIEGLPSRRPSAEAALHAHVAAASGAGAVVHLHALAPVVAAERHPGGVPLERIEMVKAFGQDAEAAPVVPVIANSQSMAELAARFDATRRTTAGDGPGAVPAVIVARHGMYVWGDDLAQARHHAEGLEWVLSFVTQTGAAP